MFMKRKQSFGAGSNNPQDQAQAVPAPASTGKATQLGKRTTRASATPEASNGKSQQHLAVPTKKPTGAAGKRAAKNKAGSNSNSENASVAGSA